MVSRTGNSCRRTEEATLDLTIPLLLLLIENQINISSSSQTGKLVLIRLLDYSEMSDVHGLSSYSVFGRGG